MNTPIIESELVCDIQYHEATREYVCQYFYLGSLIVEKRSCEHFYLRQAYNEAVRIIKEWDDWLDQISNTELQYRRTITSSCGRLKVTESL